MEKQHVLYIHGGESFANHEDFLGRLRTQALWHLPKEGDEVPVKKWTSTLAEDLGDDFVVMAPPMPNKQNAKFDEWSIWFERHFEYLNEGAILIGHSLGAMFLAKYLSQHDLPFKPKAVFLLAGAYYLPGFDDTDCRDFLVEPKAVLKLTEKTDKLIIMHSEDDFVVPYEHGVVLNQAVPEAEFISYTDKNHFLIEEFPEIIEKIRKV
jgi:predicted alpha/beta hydrolase family esterase